MCVCVVCIAWGRFVKPLWSIVKWSKLWALELLYNMVITGCLDAGYLEYWGLSLSAPLKQVSLGGKVTSIDTVVNGGLLTRLITVDWWLSEFWGVKMGTVRNGLTYGLAGEIIIISSPWFVNMFDELVRTIIVYNFLKWNVGDSECFHTVCMFTVNTVCMFTVNAVCMFNCWQLARYVCLQLIVCPVA